LAVFLYNEGNSGILAAAVFSIQGVDGILMLVYPFSSTLK
jgi:hypothetical protein